ncbi:hypothetical protein [Rhizobium laguerreae]|uniref:hypothetical protein n=1 Tax=Rhizobium laguerreae TaxID=1076926 RepID=UPI0014416524|nr:hypothetical protein [Rhizobium laguerreae]NKM69164.1 hypothetical protein [Rhizobium laguerreae]
MANQLYPVAGSHFDIGPAVTIVPDDADLDATDFALVTWTEVKGWQSMGSIGDSKTLISEDIINSGRTLKAAGTKNAGSMQNSFIVQPSDPGQIAMIAASQTPYNYPFRVRFDDAPPVRTSPVTMTIAAPGVITWTGHGLAVDQPVKFSTTGALPTGIVAGTTYFVKTTPDANTFTVAATVGGAAITTSGTQSGVHTGATVPTGTTKMFFGIVMSAQEQGGGANTARLFQPTVEINSAIVNVAAAGA